MLHRHAVLAKLRKGLPSHCSQKLSGYSSRDGERGVASQSGYALNTERLSKQRSAFDSWSGQRTRKYGTGPEKARATCLFATPMCHAAEEMPQVLLEGPFVTSQATSKSDKSMKDRVRS